MWFDFCTFPTKKYDFCSNYTKHHSRPAEISKIMTWIRYIKGYKRACNAQCNFLVNICVIVRLPNESPEFTHNLFISCLPSPKFRSIHRWWSTLSTERKLFLLLMKYCCPKKNVSIRHYSFHKFANLIYNEVNWFILCFCFLISPNSTCLLN